LDRLLDLRREEEGRRAFELSMARQAVADADEAMRGLRGQRREVEHVLGGLSGELVGEVMTLRMIVEQIDRSLQHAHTLVTLASATVTEKEEAYAEANKRRESLERIVIPRLEQARALERLAERKYDDEVALQPYRVRGTGGA
jgi:flagellar export protein FliJ